jgi:hypothetical protein
MPRQFYTDDERMAIFTSVVDARRAKKKWAEAHVTAKKAGFKGGVAALQVFIGNQRKKNKKATREVDKKVQTSMKAARHSTSPAGQLEAAVERIVKERVGAVIQKAIESLQNAL